MKEIIKQLMTPRGLAIAVLKTLVALTAGICIQGIYTNATKHDWPVVFWIAYITILFVFTGFVPPFSVERKNDTTTPNA